MKKITAIISLALVIAALACLLCSCTALRLRGTWEGKGGLRFTFKSGKKGSYSYNIGDKTYGTDFTYETDGSKLIIDYKTDSKSAPVTFEIKISGKTLTMTRDGHSYEYKKVK